MGWTTCRVRMRTTRSYSHSRSSPVLKEAARQLTPNHASNLPSTRRDCRSYRTVRPSVRTRDLDRAFTNVLRHVVRMRTRQVPHRQASTPRPPHVMFLTRPSPRLAIFIACYVARAGEGLGTRLRTGVTRSYSLFRTVCGIPELRIHTYIPRAHKTIRVRACN